MGVASVLAHVGVKLSQGWYRRFQVACKNKNGNMIKHVACDVNILN